MKASLRIISALAEKHLTDVIKNPSLLVCCLMPALIMLLLSSIIGDDFKQDELPLQYLTASSLAFVSGMVPSTATLFPMSEERDKHTLRTLLLADVSMSQMVTSRGIVASLVVAFVCILCYLIIGMPLNYLLPCTLIGIAGSLSLVLYSLAMGTIARDQMTASFYCLPAVLLGVIPMLLWYSETLAQTIPFLPTGGAFMLAELTLQGNLFSTNALLPFATTLVWIVLGAILLDTMLKRTNGEAATT